METCAYIQVALPLRLEWIPFYSVPRESEVKPEVGDKVRVRFSGRIYVGVVTAVHDSLPKDLPASKVLPIIAVETSLARVDAKEIEFWQQIADYYMCSVGEVFKTAFPAMKIDREEIEVRKKERLDARMAKLRETIATSRPGTKKVARCKEDLERLEASLQQNGFDDSRIGEIVLSPAQEQAEAGVANAFKAKKVALLQGVTGSGKTEIYTRLAAKVLSQGRNVLYLVPEIALSRQLEERLEHYFGDSLLVFHSHESTARRGQVASLIAAVAQKAGQHPGQQDTAQKPGQQPGQQDTAQKPEHQDTAQKPGTYIVLGTRSALFLPHHDLGLIVVDEEHDGSYKQDSPAPRYNGRDVAIMLAKLQGADIVLGSATPSLESSYNCQTGRFAHIVLNERYHNGGRIEVEIIDTRAERRKRGMHGSFSRKLIQHMNETIADGGQVLLLRGRRSYSPVVQCVDCGDIPKCPRCNVSLSLHRTAGGERLICHHCGYSLKYDGSCRVCGGVMHGIGAGTQKIEEEAAKLFPTARIARLDSDVARKPKEEAAIIKNFSEGGIDILIGTQMVSKGFDFANLRLVAVMEADAMLAMQDFRADEKAGQLLDQVCGRCARRDKDGLFVIQTAKPDHPVFTRMEEGTDSGFVAELLEERRDFGYPPYCRLLYIYLKDNYPDRADRMAMTLTNAIYTALGSRTEKKLASVTGPYTPVKETEDGFHIRAVRVSLPRTRDLAAAKKAIRGAIIGFEKDNRYDGHVSVDVDPA